MFVRRAASDAGAGPLCGSRGVRSDSEEGPSPSSWFEWLERILEAFPFGDFTLGALTLTALMLGVRENMATLRWTQSIARRLGGLT